MGVQYGWAVEQPETRDQRKNPVIIKGFRKTEKDFLKPPHSCLLQTHQLLPYASELHVSVEGVLLTDTVTTTQSTKYTSFSFSYKYFTWPAHRDQWQSDKLTRLVYPNAKSQETTNKNKHLI